MKFIARYLNLIGLLLLASFLTAAASLYFHTPKATVSKPAPAIPVAAVQPAQDKGCCAEKAIAPEPAPAMTCPHLAAQAKAPESCCPNH